MFILAMDTDLVSAVLSKNFVIILPKADRQIIDDNYEIKKIITIVSCVFFFFFICSCFFGELHCIIKKTVLIGSFKSTQSVCDILSMTIFAQILRVSNSKKSFKLSTVYEIPQNLFLFTVCLEF